MLIKFHLQLNQYNSQRAGRKDRDSLAKKSYRSHSASTSRLQEPKFSRREERNVAVFGIVTYLLSFFSIPFVANSSQHDRWYGCTAWEELHRGRSPARVQCQIYCTHCILKPSICGSATPSSTAVRYAFQAALHGTQWLKHTITHRSMAQAPWTSRHLG